MRRILCIAFLGLLSVVISCEGIEVELDLKGLRTAKPAVVSDLSAATPATATLEDDLSAAAPAIAAIEEGSRSKEAI